VEGSGDIGPVGLKVPVFWSYSSAAARKVGSPPVQLAGPPPATRTCPSGSRVAVWPPWAFEIEPVSLNTPVLGS